MVGESFEIAVGIGFGNYHIMHMGGVLRRIEVFVAGEALQKALACLRTAHKENPVAVSTEVWKYIEEFFSGDAEITKDLTNSGKQKRVNVEAKP